MKRKLLFPAALMLAVTLCFGLAACGEEEDAFALKDFPAETTETAELGSVYSLKTDVEAEDGATYRLSAEVLTKDGGAVAVFDNRFDVTDVSGYTITYTVVTTRDVPQSVVTLNVTDNTAPEIAINKPDAGVLNVEYCLPAFTVTDLAESSPDVSVALNFVNGAEKEEISLTKREGRYYFKPEKLGSYEFAVTASKSNGKSRTVTRTFVVDQPVLAGEVFSPEVLDPASQISFVAAGGVPTERLVVGTGTSEDGAYTGKYLSVDGSDIGNNLWVDIHLTPRQGIESYADFDTVEFWVYFVMTGENAKVGILGGSTGATDPLLREFAGNTWAKISVDAATFFDKIDSARLFTVNFNNATSGNHAGLTEVRIGTVMAKYAFESEVTVNAPATTMGAYSSVTLTADTDIAFTAEIKNAEGDTQQCNVEENVVTASLPVGSYTYTLTSADDLYVGSVTGTFTVECNTQIVLPEDVTGTALTQFTIPEAKITVDGKEVSGTTAKHTAVFTPAYGDAVVSNITEAIFTPASSGTLVITYTYEGAVSKTLEVPIAKAENNTGALLDMRTADVLANVRTNNTETAVTYDADNDQLVWKSTVGSSTGWRSLYVDFGVTAAELTERNIDYISVDVYYKTTEQATADVVGWLCGGSFKVGETATTSTRIPRNTWYTIYIPAQYLTDNVLGGTTDLLQVIFEYANARFNYIEEVYLKGFVPVTEEKIPATTTLVDGASASSVNCFKPTPDSGEIYTEITSSDGYLSWKPIASAAKKTWQKIGLAQLAPCNAADIYQYIAIKLYYVSGDSGENLDASGYFFGDKCTFGTGNNGADVGLTVNQWVTVYLPVDIFYSSNAAGGSAYFLQCSFDQSGNGHFPGISEVRIGGIFFTNTAGSAATDYVFTANA